MRGIILCALLSAATLLTPGESAATCTCGDLDDGGAIAATDALLLLKKAVGQDVTLTCPTSACSTTTTSGPTTTTTLAASCGNAVVDAGEDCDGDNGPCFGGNCQANCRCDNFTTCGDGSVGNAEECDGNDSACGGGPCDNLNCLCTNKCQNTSDCSGQPCVQGLCVDPCQSTADCDPGRSCSVILSETQTACRDNNAGGAPTFAACTADADCASDLCISGDCTEVCASNADCGSEACVDLSGLPPICQDVCNALVQSECPLQTEGCYFSLFTLVGSCAIQAAPKAQGTNCSFVNDCLFGYGCTLPNDPNNPTGSACAYMCDASNSGGPACSDPAGPGAAFSCVAINDFYGDIDAAPADLGMCLDPNEFPQP